MGEGSQTYTGGIHSHYICRLGDFQGGPRQVSPQGFRGDCGYSVAMV